MVAAAADPAPLGGGASEWTHLRSTVKADIDANPIDWWIHRTATFPLLFPIAVRGMVIQATSFSSERAFSAMGRIITERRTRLKPEHAETLIMLNQNIDVLNTFPIATLRLLTAPDD